MSKYRNLRKFATRYHERLCYSLYAIFARNFVDFGNKRYPENHIFVYEKNRNICQFLCKVDLGFLFSLVRIEANYKLQLNNLVVMASLECKG